MVVMVVVVFVEVFKGTRQKRFSGFCPLRGGGTPLSAKGFLAMKLKQEDIN